MRDSTPEIEHLWDPNTRHAIEHQIWLAVHDIQSHFDPNRYGHIDASKAYRDAAKLYAYDSGVAANTEQVASLREAKTRHDLAARLVAFEEMAGDLNPATGPAAVWGELHRGLTSCDVTEVETQVTVRRSLEVIGDHLGSVVQKLADKMLGHRDIRLVARTHGQPAQLTTLGLRWAQVLQPLLDLYGEVQQVLRDWPLRGIKGAVGTCADQLTVLTGRPDADGDTQETAFPLPGSPLGPSVGTDSPMDRLAKLRDELEQAAPVVGEVYDRHFRHLADLLSSIGQAAVDLAIGREQSAAQPPDPTVAPNRNGVMSVFDLRLEQEFGFSRTQDATGQLYHRSYDLQIAALLARIASVGQSYAQVVRQMALSGLAQESFLGGQVGSSAMPHKHNPRLSERICAYATATRGYLSMFAEAAGLPWAEGDLSTSATRRVAYPAMFGVVDALLADWRTVIEGLEVDRERMAAEIDAESDRTATGPLLGYAIWSGVRRADAYRTIQDWSSLPDASVAELSRRLGTDVSGLSARLWYKEGPVGNSDLQIARVAARVRSEIRPVVAWTPERP